MKKIISLVTVVLTACSAGFGQVDIKLWDHLNQNATGNNLNGTEHLVAAASDGEYAITFNFKNTSGISKEWKIERFRITDTPGWEDRLNWGVANDPMQEQGYGSGQMNSNPWTVIWGYTVSPGNSLNLTAIASVQGAGEELYRYYLVENNGTRVDSIDYRVTTSLGIGTNEKESIIVVYPNPVSNILTVNTTGLEGSVELKMVDVLGKMVLTESGAASMNKVDVSNFKNGVYLIFVYNKGDLIQTKRIVVKH